MASQHSSLQNHDSMMMLAAAAFGVCAYCGIWANAAAALVMACHGLDVSPSWDRPWLVGGMLADAPTHTSTQTMTGVAGSHLQLLVLFDWMQRIGFLAGVGGSHNMATSHCLVPAVETKTTTVTTHVSAMSLLTVLIMPGAHNPCWHAWLMMVYVPLMLCLSCAQQTSLSDFWGRRWNLPAGASLKTLFYDPIVEGRAVHKIKTDAPSPDGPGVKGAAAAQIDSQQEHHELRVQQLQGLAAVNGSDIRMHTTPALASVEDAADAELVTLEGVLPHTQDNDSDNTVIRATLTPVAEGPAPSPAGTSTVTSPDGAALHDVGPTTQGQASTAESAIDRAVAQLDVTSSAFGKVSAEIQPAAKRATSATGMATGSGSGASGMTVVKEATGLRERHPAGPMSHVTTAGITGATANDTRAPTGPGVGSGKRSKGGGGSYGGRVSQGRRVMATAVTFFMSGVMHEVLLWYCTGAASSQQRGKQLAYFMLQVSSCAGGGMLPVCGIGGRSTCMKT